MSEAALNPVLQAVGLALVHFLWQGTLAAAGLSAGLALIEAAERLGAVRARRRGSGGARGAAGGDGLPVV